MSGSGSPDPKREAPSHGPDDPVPAIEPRPARDTGAVGLGAPSGTIRVAVVDDEPAVRTIVRMLIARHPGFELVVEAGDVADAIGPLQAQHPDVVLLDLLLPGGSGVDALDEVTASAPGAMVVILSALSAVDEAQRAFDAGAFAYLEKSVLGPSLLTEIAELRTLHVREGADAWDLPGGPSRIRR